ncbi:MAG: hypothetical protein AB8C84_02625 [Oligoflexales bacterium]
MQHVTIALTLYMLACVLQGAVDSPYTPGHHQWAMDPSIFKIPKNLPIEDKIIEIKPSEQQIRKRILSSQTREEIGHITIYISRKNIDEKAIKYSQPPFRKHFKKWALSQLEKSSAKLITLTPETLEWINLKKVSEKFAQVHHDLKLHPLPKRKARQLSRRMRPFFIKKQYQSLKKKLLSKKSLRVDQHLLPSFAKRAVRHFTIFRGPNCFHASLAFQNEQWTKLAGVNIRREKNHHKSMINHDELDRALKQYFYPVQPPFKYGDLMVFADLPEKPHTDLHYRWIKHAATWLFDGYVFSKGSKSPNSPWTVKTFHEEWDRWSKNTKRLGIKVFRRSQEHVKKQLPIDPVDWLY